MNKLPASVLPSFDEAARTQTTASDIGEYRAEDIKNLTHENKIRLLKHSFRPASNYKFPSKMEYGNCRSFRHAWLQEFPWLSYSRSLEGGFCTNCVLFSKNKKCGWSACHVIQ